MFDIRSDHGFRQRIVDVHGITGIHWLSQLASLLSRCEDRWSLKISPPFQPLSYNYVAPAVRADTTEIVIKAGVPGRDLATEIEALRFFDGVGCVRLLDADAELGVLLLERARPGQDLTSLPDDERATAAAIQVMQQLWRAAPANKLFPSVADWVSCIGQLRERFGGDTGPFPRELVEAAELLFADLNESMGEAVLLHGDLHHENILSSDRQSWLAIDPKGVIGEREYEVGALLRNPLSELLKATDPKYLLKRRIDQITECLGFDPQRVLSWGFAQAMLAAWWEFEDHGMVSETSLSCAELLREIKDRGT